MEINSFIENFANEFTETDSSLFKSDTKFRNLEEWSSIMALSIMAMVDEEYDVRLNGNDIRKSETIEDLFQVIQTKRAL